MRVSAIPQTIFPHMALQADTKEWLKAVASYMNLSLSDLALRAKLAPSTITRYVYDKTNTLGITQRSLDAIAEYSGVPKHVMPGQRRLPGFGESEAMPYSIHQADKLPDWVLAAIEAHKAGRPGVEPWIMKGWALDLLGIIPGDVVMIDQNRRPKAGDIVVAQLTDLGTGQAETVMRRYDPPFLNTHSAKMGPARPEQVDDERVIIMGAFDGLIRPRQ